MHLSTYFSREFSFQRVIPQEPMSLWGAFGIFLVTLRHESPLRAFNALSFKNESTIWEEEKSLLWSQPCKKFATGLHHSSPLNVCGSCSINLFWTGCSVGVAKNIMCFLLLDHAPFPMTIEYINIFIYSLEDLLVLHNGSSFGFLLNANNNHHNDNPAGNQ